jgi:predicted metalloendopeptidase
MAGGEGSGRGVELRSFVGSGAKPGDFVAPTIRVAPGQQLNIAIDNKLEPCTDQQRSNSLCFNDTNLHTHGLWVSPSFQDPTRYSPFLFQGGLGMPDREYYLSDADAMKKVRTAYLAHITAILKLAGIADAEAKASRIMVLETKIAQSHASRSDSGVIQKGNNLWARADFAAKAPRARLERLLRRCRPRQAEDVYRLAARRC